MKAVLLFSLSIIVLGVKAWPPVKNPFELIAPQHKIHTISDCMHVTSEEGDFIYKKSPHLMPLGFEKESNMLEAPNPMTVCGLYVVAEPDHIVEITLKHFDINCESGGLMAFVDGWELNGEYFPGEHDHHKPLEQRVNEFCNDYSHWPVMSFKKFFRSSQNAALLQYRIPVRGSFIANVHFRKITEPCNIMVQDTLSVYNLSNHGRRGNCTLTALFPAVISLLKVHVGVRNQQGEHVSYECNSEDRVEIGGSSGLDSHAMEKSSDVCGYTETQGPEQAIFCGVTSARLISSGKHHNEAAILIRQADENDLEIATLVCPL